MGDQIPSNTDRSSDEIDLGQLLQLIKRGLNGIFRGFLRIFLYLKRRAIKLGALILIGMAIGLLMNTFVPKKLKAEVIVKPNFESKDYLYDVVDEVQSNVRSKDTIFFQKLGIDVDGMRSFSVKVEPIEELVLDKEMAEENNKYLEILENYKESDFVLDIVKSEILKKSTVTHRITFSHRNPEKGPEYATKIMEYINSNPYFGELQKIYTNNAKSKIAQNQNLIAQIDELVANYSNGLADRESKSTQGMVFLENENNLNIPTLLSLKNGLIKEMENKQIEMAEQKDAISIINFGKTQVVKKPLFGKNLVLFPIILLGAYFVLSFISYLNRKTKEVA